MHPSAVAGPLRRVVSGRGRRCWVVGGRAPTRIRSTCSGHRPRGRPATGLHPIAIARRAKGPSQSSWWTRSSVWRCSAIRRDGPAVETCAAVFHRSRPASSERGAGSFAAGGRGFEIPWNPFCRVAPRDLPGDDGKDVVNRGAPRSVKGARTRSRGGAGSEDRVRLRGGVRGAPDTDAHCLPCHLSVRRDGPPVESGRWAACGEDVHGSAWIR